jgi:hypothetical protein
MTHRAFIAAALAAVWAAVPLPGQSPGGGTSCEICHSDAELFDEDFLAIVERYRQDVHAAAGLGCHDCHGGNPAPETAEDLLLAKDEELAENPYRGAPLKADVPGFCGRCHSDPAYMRRFRPDLRVDQEQEYRTSFHGAALARGSAAAATCVDCHGHHGILAVADPNSPVYPTHVAETCKSCHSDPERMAGVTLADGRALPTDQYARWRASVHAAALHDKADFSAPTCNDCHGNHGATPPGVDSIGFVCGQCHGREARLFRESGKHSGFEAHNELVEGAGEEGCAACHVEPEAPAKLTGVRSFSECATCHGNHAIVRPTMAMLGPLPETPCAFCHEGVLADEVPEPEAKSKSYTAMRDSLLAAARSRNLQGDEVFDWLVDQALALPNHTVLEGSSDGNPPELRPEFRNLFEKFRIGKTAYTFEDPEGQGAHRVEIVRCNHCHGPEVEMADEPLGHRAAEETLERMRELTARVARAERILLAARRGGVETRGALAEIEAAVGAQIGLQVLLHSFDVGEGSEFAGRQQEGIASAHAALEAGHAALGELGDRRRGLTIALVFVVLAAVALAFKIRELSAREVSTPRDPPAEAVSPD